MHQCHLGSGCRQNSQTGTVICNRSSLVSSGQAWHHDFPAELSCSRRARRKDYRLLVCWVHLCGGGGIVTNVTQLCSHPSLDFIFISCCILLRYALACKQALHCGCFLVSQWTCRAERCSAHMWRGKVQTGWLLIIWFETYFISC